MGFTISTHVGSLLSDDKDRCLFDGTRTYVVPGYQRPYEWDKDKIEKMMETLVDFFKDAGETQDDSLLFGTIHLNVNHQGKYEIIDGQQRMVSFYLLLKVLNEKGLPLPKFTVENQIQENYDNEFKNAAEEGGESVYAQNYRTIKEYLEKADEETGEKDEKKLDLKGFYDVVSRSVRFVVIETRNTPSIERTLQIFTSLNTTGLPLDTKDVFKVSFCDFLKSQGKEEVDTTDIIETINKAYLNLEEIKYVSKDDPDTKIRYIYEDDLLDVYRFYILSKSGKNVTRDLRASNMKFFTELFKDSSDVEGPDTLSADTLKSISEVIKKTEEIINKQLETEASEDGLIYLARDILDWSGYGRLKNMLYFLTYRASLSKNGEVCEKDVTEACKTTFYLAELCAVYRMKHSRIVNEIFTFVSENILKSTDDSGKFAEKIKAKLKGKKPEEKYTDLVKNFIDLLSGKESVCDNSRLHYFLFFSYAQDCKNSGRTLADISKDLFRRNKWDIDVEHIRSKKFFNFKEDGPVTETEGNSLGNILYLEQDINRRLGRLISERTDEAHRIKTPEQDYFIKAGDGKQEYYKSKLTSVTEFLKFLNAHEKTERITKDLIKERNKLKADFVMELHEDIMPESTKADLEKALGAKIKE